MDAELVQKLRRATEELFPPHRVLVAYAHGSRIRGNPLPDSDLDIGYYLEDWQEGEELPLQAELLLEANLARVVGLDVDLRNLAQAPLEMRGQILETGIRVYSSSPEQRVDLETYLMARYLDYKEVYREMHELRLNNMARQGV